MTVNQGIDRLRNIARTALRADAAYVENENEADDARLTNEMDRATQAFGSAWTPIRALSVMGVVEAARRLYNAANAGENIVGEVGQLKAALDLWETVITDGQSSVEEQR